tara:strand:+ start:185 stop:349 length:165 start_codon:yes stop_codon:yes gene_type:complete
MTRTCKLEYLVHEWPTVATIDKDGEYEIKQSRHCKAGETVWVLRGEDFVETKII